MGVTSGGTGAADAATARTNLGLVIGTHVQAPLAAGTDYLTPTGSAASLTNFPTLNQNTTGNAATATKLATAIKINTIDFDGSADITVTAAATAETLEGTTIKSTVTGSSLTKVGTITTGVWNGSNIAVNKGGTGATAVTGTGKNVLSKNPIMDGLTSTAKILVGPTSGSSTSAIIEGNSTTQGFLPPRMTDYQRSKISNPVAGLIVWCRNCGSNGELNVYNGSSWTNMTGGTTGAAAAVKEVGEPYLGGIIFYVLVSGDPGYDAATPHGLIGADPAHYTATTKKWYDTTTTSVSGTSLLIGQGAANTEAIIGTLINPANYAAGFAAAYRDANSYSDWYLPSRNEIKKFYDQRRLFVDISFDIGDPAFWTSSEYDARLGYVLDFGDVNDLSAVAQKNNSLYVWPIKSF